MANLKLDARGHFVNVREVYKRLDEIYEETNLGNKTDLFGSSHVLCVEGILPGRGFKRLPVADRRRAQGTLSTRRTPPLSGSAGRSTTPRAARRRALR